MLRAGAQVVIVLVVGLVAYLLWSNLTASMARTNLTFGLGFLDTTAGFEIGETPIPYSATDTYGQAFLVGLLNTLVVSVLGVILATILGILVGVARLSTNWIVNRLAAGFVEVMRNTPLLVQLVLLYAVLIQLPPVAQSIRFGDSLFINQRGLFLPKPIPEPAFQAWLVVVALAIASAVGLRMLAARREAAGRPIERAGLLGLLVLVGVPVAGYVALGGPITFEPPVLDRFNFVGGIVLSPEFTALLVGLVIYTAAFIGEIVRGGIQAVRRGQIQAARALGLNDGQILSLVVFPQALRVIVPPLTSQYLNLAKNSSLAIAIGFPDLFQVSTTMANQTGQPVSVIVLVMGTYLAISLIFSVIMNVYNRRVQVLER